MLFKVDVESVQVANRQGKLKRSGRFNGRRNHTRRAFVCLKPGQEINFTEEAK
jgi:large subunit ribosomal protein L23